MKTCEHIIGLDFSRDIIWESEENFKLDKVFNFCPLCGEKLNGN